MPCTLADMDPQLHAQDNLAHAQWKVNFIRHLIQAHLRSSKKETTDWQGRHAAMLHRLASAEDEVNLSKQALEALNAISGSERIPPCADTIEPKAKPEAAPSGETET